MLIKGEADAEAYLDLLVVEHMQAHVELTREQAVKIERENLAYYAGLCSNETRERVERLFKCAHPVFGSIAINGPPAPEEAESMGRLAGRLKVGDQ
jgi:hypothetical protein